MTRYIEPAPVAELTAVLFEAALKHNPHPSEAPTPRFVAQHATALHRCGRALLNLAVIQCNRQWTDRDQKRRDRLKAEAQAIAADYGARSRLAEIRAAAQP